MRIRQGSSRHQAECGLAFNPRAAALSRYQRLYGAKAYLSAHRRPLYGNLNAMISSVTEFCQGVFYASRQLQGIRVAAGSGI